MATLQHREPQWIATAPHVNRAERTIDAPVEVVWAAIADHAAWPTWFTALKRVEVTGAAEGVGGTRAVTVPGMTLHEVFTAWEPGRRFAFTVERAAPVLAALAESVELEPHGAGCRITYVQGFEARRGFDWVVRLVARKAGRDLVAAVDRLAVRCEASAGT
jgi:uncharacterized protein YndB with AHSA1/START domain